MIRELTPEQLEWCRNRIPHFRLAEADATAVKRDEQRSRHMVSLVATENK